MVLKKQGEYSYGETQADIRDEIVDYSKHNSYVAEHFADAVCECGSKVFFLALDDDAGAAVRKCIGCEDEHAIGDSGEFLEEAELEERACVCGGEEFEITVGVSLYRESDDVRWLYVGCRCPKCGLTGVYGDWKNEFNGFRELLSRV
jgi:hypothetical protein